MLEDRARTVRLGQAGTVDGWWREGRVKDDGRGMTGGGPTLPSPSLSHAPLTMLALGSIVTQTIPQVINACATSLPRL